MRRLALCVVLAAPACSLKQLAVETTAGVLHDGSRAFDSEPDLEIARGAAPAQLKSIEGLLVSAPKNRTLLSMAARGYLEFAFGFLEDDLESLAAEDAALPERLQTLARATRMYDRAYGYALRYLATYDPGFQRALDQGGDALDAALGRLPKGAVAGLAYGGMALASSINLNRADPARVARLPLARRLVERAHALDPSFYFGGPAMTLGILAVERGDRAQARRYFRDAIAASKGRYLLPRVMRARKLLVESHDRKRFEEELRAVLEEPSTILPRARLANEIARRRAARYLVQEKKLF